MRDGWPNLYGTFDFHIDRANDYIAAYEATPRWRLFRRHNLIARARIHVRVASGIVTLARRSP